MEDRFFKLITELKEQLKQQSKPLKDFTLLTKPEKGKNLVWIMDQHREIGHTKVHYEVSLEGDLIWVEIHFEIKDLEKRAKFKNDIPNLPEKITWYTNRSSLSIRFIGNNLKLNNQNIIREISQQLLYLEVTVGDRIREVLNEINYKKK